MKCNMLPYVDAGINFTPFIHLSLINLSATYLSIYFYLPTLFRWMILRQHLLVRSACQTFRITQQLSIPASVSTSSADMKPVRTSAAEKCSHHKDSETNYQIYLFSVIFLKSADLLLTHLLFVQ